MFSRRRLAARLSAARVDFFANRTPIAATRYVERAGEAYLSCLFGDDEYAAALAEVWSFVRRRAPARPQPTVEELENILAGPDRDVYVLPDGSVAAR
jgi:hypothetical protein